MNAEELEKKLGEVVAEFMTKVHEIGKEIAELKESKKEGKWKPQVGEMYWYKNDMGDIKSSQYMCYVDEFRANNLLLFPTKEECERYWHFMDTVKEKSYEFSKEDWEDGEIGKWRIIYDGEAKGFCAERNYLICVFNATYFKSREDAQYIIDNFKEELMEYWL